MDHHVQPLMLLPHHCNQFGNLPRIGQIAGHRLDLPALLLQRLGGILRFLQLQIRHHHRRAQLSKGTDDRQPDALRTARHQHHLPLERISRIGCIHRTIPVDGGWCSAPAHGRLPQNCSAR
ncbi:hypothetical protein D3C71_1406830 [compost metagenome]